jgi:2',3'-cyclic-nucleotide 2'-phosphodiesterase (5'-nucleotidase family)
MTRRWTLGLGIALIMGCGIGCGGDDDDGGNTEDTGTGDTLVADSSKLDGGGDTPAETSPDTPAETTPDTPVTDADAGPPKPTLDIQILSISDWHGQLDPVAESDANGVSQTYGGVGILSTYFAKERAANPNTLLFTSGDIMGATPTLSSVFLDKPAVESLNFLKLDGDTLGNHDFDRGLPTLKQRISEAKYHYISSNLTNTDVEIDDTTVGSKVEKPFFLYTLGGTDPAKKVTVGVVGITNPDAPILSFPGAFKTMVIKEPIAAATAAAAAARAAGAQVVIALVHMGITGKDTTGVPSGPLIDFAKGLSGIDLVLGDHTDLVANVKIGDVQVLENRSKGRTYGRTIIKVVDGKVTAVTPTVVDPAFVDTAYLLKCTAATAATDCESGVCTVPTGATVGKCAAKTCVLGSTTCTSPTSCADCKTGICPACTTPTCTPGTTTCTSATSCADCESGTCTVTSGASGKCKAKTCTVAGDCSSGVCSGGSCAFCSKTTCSIGCTGDVAPAVVCPAATSGPAYKCIGATPSQVGLCQRNIVDPDPLAESTVLKPYRDTLGAEFDKTIAVATDILPRDGSIERKQETAQGDLIAAALLDRYKVSNGAQIAFTNGGGIRAPLPSSYLPNSSLTTLRRSTGTPFAAGPPYDLVVGDIFTTLPFGNTCIVRKISGDLLWQVLEKSVFAKPAISGGFLQIAGFKYSFQVSKAPGARVLSVTLLDGSSGGAGKDIPKGDPTLYTLVTNDFTNAGGDGYSMLIETVPSPKLDIMADVLKDYIKAHSPVSTAIAGLITEVP